ncbi:phosphotransferase [Granulicella sp. S156]|uniref:phosphotransferase n=1 Tax=Granulicella sp. S156 TaxID=1747224 RepID=UPI00131B1D3C|nr:phosphotransferase [Granulicella sp. S156]
MMSVNGQNAEQEEFRVALVLPWSRMVLVDKHGETNRLPRISIPKQFRVAEQLTGVLQAIWAVRLIVLDLLPKSEELPSCAVIEVRGLESRVLPEGLMAVSVEDVTAQDLTQLERSTVRSILAGDPQDRGPFSRVGWIEEAQAWIRESVVDRDVEFNGNIQQLSAGRSSALVCFETMDGPTYWLKATSGRNTHELSTTRLLSRYCPQCLPPFIAARADWNAWITEEAGQPLYDALSFNAFEQATHCLAELQLTSAAQVEDLLACGCFDQRMPILRSHLPATMQYLEDAMARQTSTKVPPLSTIRLRELRRLIEEATFALEALGIPDALVHNDLNPGNILVDGTRAVFTDWSEACIGCPFLTFRNLQVQAFEADETQTWARRIREIYKKHWEACLSESQIERAFALSPPLAIVSYLCGRDPSFTSMHRGLDSVQSYARSLARHLDRFAQYPEFLEALCSYV